ncbi:MAG: hypothetical protein HRT72_08845 [Flavobacteriales bacterium]|nr:hypothetical protein [Flavobacteriales bacterium]
MRLNAFSYLVATSLISLILSCYNGVEDLESNNDFETRIDSTVETSQTETTLLDSSLAEEKELEQNKKRKIMTKRLELSSEDSIKFWVIGDTYIERSKSIRSQIRELRKERAREVSDERGIEMLNQRLSLKEAEVRYEKEFSNELLGVISAKKVVIYFRMEESYTKRTAQRKKKQNAQQRRKKNMEKRQENKKLTK